MCATSGCVFKKRPNNDQVEYIHCPIALAPYPFPAHLIEQAFSYQTELGVMFSQLASKQDTMLEILKGTSLSDKFVQRLVEVSKKA